MKNLKKKNKDLNLTERSTMNENKAMGIQEHFDYKKNINWGAKFIKNYNDSHSDKFFGLRTHIGNDNEHYFFMFSFSIPLQYGNHPHYANPVNPNQSFEEFMDEFKHTFAAYNRMQKKWERSHLGNKNFEAFNPRKS